MACSGFSEWRQTKTRNTPDSIFPPWLLVDIIFRRSHNNYRRQTSILSLSLSSSFSMDFSEIARKLGLKESKQVVRKAAELRRISDLQFDSSSAGIGEICKAVICLEIAANKMQVLFDRQTAIRLSGMSEKAYIRSFNVMQNGIGVKNRLDIKELAIQFGCVRLIPLVQKGLSLYRDRFIASLPLSRRASTDCTRPVFTATAFYLCAKKHKLKVDKIKLIELSGTSEDEFSSVSTSMKDICHDVFGVANEKKDPKSVKRNRDLLDVLPEKRQAEDGGYSSDEGEDLSAYKKRKRQDSHKYEEWKSTVVESNKQNKEKIGVKRTKQAQLNFLKRDPGMKVGAT
ncbi:hypothetical protein L1887_15342 [Cichorium endivia]|nr:hypothetical protein L1887_15342 [Cichorium endivia]